MPLQQIYWHGKVIKRKGSRMTDKFHSHDPAYQMKLCIGYWNWPSVETWEFDSDASCERDKQPPTALPCQGVEVEGHSWRGKCDFFLPECIKGFTWKAFMHNKLHGAEPIRIVFITNNSTFVFPRAYCAAFLPGHDESNIRYNNKRLLPPP